MKIEKVGFDNINSLCGHFEVDFTHPSLTDAGIFVITGPTGVGKTSLLDAVSFALYGRTARQKGVTTDRDELMSHGMSFCQAEVQFEKGKRRYQVSTEHRRRRSGEGFSQHERRLEELLPDGSTVLLANQVKEVARRVDEITGLKFDNFCRCMMLAQGKFAQFMEADAPRRSEVLSTITGTEIYQAVGEQVYRHWAELKQQMDSIHFLPVLSDADREVKEEAWRMSKTRKAEADARCGRLKAGLKLIQDREAARESLAQRRLALQNAQAAAEAFVAQGLSTRLQMGEAAWRVRPDIVKRDAARKTLRDVEEELKQQVDWLAANQEPLRVALAAEQAAQCRLDAEKPPIEQTLTLLREQVRPLEIALGKAAVAMDAAQKNAMAGAKGRQAAEKLYQQAEQALQKAQADACRKKGEFDALRADAPLVQALPLLSQRLADWAKQPSAGEPLPAGEDLQRQLAEVKQARAQRLAGRREEDLPLMLVRLNQLIQSDKTLGQKKSELAAVEQAELEARRQLAALPSVEDAEKLCASCQESTRLALAVAGLEAQLDSLYEDFKAGKYACCPCCGSPVPHERVVVSGEVEAKKKAERAARLELEKRRAAWDKASRHADSLANRLVLLRAAVDDALAQRSLHLQELGWEEMPSDAAERCESLRACISELGEWKRKEQELESQLALDAKRALFLEELRPCSPEIPQSLAQAEQCLGLLKRRVDAYVAAEKHLQSAQQAEQSALQALDRERKAWEAAGEAASLAAQEAESAKAAWQKAGEALKALWQGGSADDEEKALRGKVAALDAALAAAHRCSEELRVRFARHESLKADAEKRRPERCKECAEQESALQQVLEREGFESEAACLQALVPTEEMSALRERQQGLNQAVAQAWGAAQETEKQLAALEAQDSVSMSAEELAGRIEAAESLCREVEEQVSALRSELLQDDAARNGNRDKEAQCADLKAGLDGWGTLMELMGKTKDGFKKYAQQITFDILVQHANVQLRHLSDRYTLVSDPARELELCVLDRYRDAEEARACSNLSGGETFIVSLALALGLSRMAGSKTRIDTLFLDEGFGTLDEDALERVLDSLQNLRADGKLVGIISHVEKLQSRLSARIALERCGSSPYSTFLPHEAVVAQPVKPGSDTKEAKRNAEEKERRAAIAAALAAGPLTEKNINAALGYSRGNRALLKDMVEQGILVRENSLYRLA